MKTIFIFKRLFNFPFIVVKRMKTTKRVGICDSWITVAYYKNSEIALNEKNTKNQISKSYTYSFREGKGLGRFRLPPC